MNSNMNNSLHYDAYYEWEENDKGNYEHEDGEYVLELNIKGKEPNSHRNNPRHKVSEPGVYDELDYDLSPRNETHSQNQILVDDLEKKYGCSKHKKIAIISILVITSIAIVVTGAVLLTYGLQNDITSDVDFHLETTTTPSGCTYRGTIGNGRERGTCNEDFLCQPDGKCKPICKVAGSKGDGKSRGSCNERQICFSDGSCRFSDNLDSTTSPTGTTRKVTKIAPPIVTTSISSTTIQSNPSGCGKTQIRERIYGGSEAQPHSLPWHVGLRDGDKNRPFCGGVLISLRHVLTTVVCTTRRNIAVIVGGHDINDITDERILAVSKVVLHPNYSLQSLDYDFAIIFLAELVPSESRAIPACLPHISMSGDFLAGKDLTISGWGETDSLGSTPTNLRSAVIQGVSNPKCRNLYSIIDQFEITDRMICAGNLEQGGVDACRGDGGGPLTYSNNDGVVTVVGLSSFGLQCGSAQYPGVYSRITSVLPWIEENIM